MTSVALKAQNKAIPSNIDGKDIYVLLVNTNKNTSAGNLSLTKDQLNNIHTFEDRIQLILKNAPTSNFDAITTRDGNSIQFIKYQNKENITPANVPNYSGKEVYFLSKPVKEYSIIDSRLASTEELSSSFYNLANKLVKADNKKKFDAIIVSNEKIEYIRFK